MIERCKAGDQNGFTELFRRYQLQAWRLGYAITGDPHFADDITQEAFLQAFRRIHNLRPGAPFGPWFCAIVANRARRLAGRVRWRRWLPLPRAEAVPDVSADRHLHCVEVRTELWQAVHELSIDLRTIIGMRFALDMSEVDIATALKIPLGTVKSRLFRAKHALQRSLTKGEGKEETAWTSPMK